MRRPVCYDVTRLLTRILNPTPNGIDRVDHALAQHFLAGDPATTFGATATGVGARLLPGEGAAEAIAGIAAHWRETSRNVEADPVYRYAVDWLSGGSAPPPRPRRRRRPPLLPIGGTASWLMRHGLPLRTPGAHLPRGSLYLNSSQFPLWVASSFQWLEARRDVRACFFVHDLLPISMPEYFRLAEMERHRRRLVNFARFAAAAMVTTHTVADDLRSHLDRLGRRDVPVFVSPTPVSPTFATPRIVEPLLGARSYFVLCSTIEPRKNHLMILAVWRAMAARLGREAPALVLVGTRGWHYGPIVDLIVRSPGLHGHVLELGGLSTLGLKRLIDNARAVLMPSFGEGYGLPVHEALAAGAPVIASDIPAFREIERGRVTLLSPLDGEAWLETIAAMARTARPDGVVERPSTGGWDTYFADLDAFGEAI